MRHLIRILAVYALCAGTHASAAVGRVAEWSGVKASDLKDLSLRNYTAASHLRSSPHDSGFTDLLESILDNQGSRTSAPFLISSSLRSPVGFWLRVFTQWHSRQVVLVDEFHLDWVYGTIDLSSLTLMQGRAAVERFLQQHRRAMVRLTRLKDASQLSLIERSVWNAWGKPPLPVGRVHGHRVDVLVQQIHVQRGARDSLIRALALSEPYLPKMEAIFSEQQLPIELTRLSLLESAFQFDAVSKVGARGLWQFMERTAHDYLLLSAHSSIDERLSPWKSTVAASLLLRGNRQQLGNWFSAITAYNHGFRGLTKTSDHEREIQKLVLSSCRGKSPLGWASRNYYAEFLAVLHAEAFHAELFGDKPTLDLRPVRFIPLKKATSPREAALSLGLPVSEFLKLNPDLGGTNVRMPKGHFIAVPAAQDDFASLIARHANPVLSWVTQPSSKKGRL